MSGRYSDLQVTVIFPGGEEIARCSYGEEPSASQTRKLARAALAAGRALGYKGAYGFRVEVEISHGTEVPLGCLFDGQGQQISYHTTRVAGSSVKVPVTYLARAAASCYKTLAGPAWEDFQATVTEVERRMDELAEIAEANRILSQAGFALRPDAAIASGVG
jgi:hypothetical protein